MHEAQAGEGYVQGEAVGHSSTAWSGSGVEPEAPERLEDEPQLLEEMVVCT